MDQTVFEVAIGVLGGLLLFLFGVNRLSDTLMDRMGNQAKSILARFTSNVFTAILTGTFISLDLLLFDPFASSIERISSGMEPARQLALAHFGFNALSVAVVAPFVPLIERLLN